MNWDLTYLFKTKEDFENALKEVSSYIEKLAVYQGKLGNQNDFKDYFLLELKASELGLRAYQYASLKSDLNKKDIDGLTDLSKIASIMGRFQEATSFESPEILSLGEKKVMEFVSNNPELEEFRFSFEKLFRQNKHILSKDIERIMANFAPANEAGASLYSALAVGDNVSKDVKLSTKEVVNVTNSNFRALIAQADNAKDRKKIFEAVFEDFEKHKNTFASIYESILLVNRANAQSRNYKSILESFLFGNNIPTSVYKTLVKVAGSHTKPIKDYIKLRKKYLGIRTYHTYDRYLELASSDKEYNFEEAKELFFNSLKDFPKDFQEKARLALCDGFVDVEPKDGKRTGAYSSSMPNLNPYILLNFTNTLDDVFTVAHESGHSMHSIYSKENQPTNLQNYTIFVAEIASTFNEHVLLDYFIKSGKATKEEKIMLLQKAIDDIIATFYRQALFAEYELIAHEKIANYEPINHEVLSKIMIDLYKKYYGLDITKEDYKRYVWAYIPHLFYTPFYVYQYATSFAASFKIYEDVKNNVPGAFDRYIGLLKSGGSKYPMDEAREAGVDFTKKETFMAVYNRLNDLVRQLTLALEE